MNTNILSPDLLRARFAEQLQAMYRSEVPAYARLHDLVLRVNESVLREAGDPRAEDGSALDALSAQRHGAIRVGSPRELAWLCRLFSLLGMFPVDFYDLVPAGLPVMSTAFRPVGGDALATSPFRMFCSLLRPELINDSAVREEVTAILAAREIMGNELRGMIERAEVDGGVSADDADAFVSLALDVFRWRGLASVDRARYEALLAEHRLIADIAAFPGPHINHLTPSTLDIDRLQASMIEAGFNAKALVEGPPPRRCPILLRQTACTAQPEHVSFPATDGVGAEGTHTARFGEVEQRGVALTMQGRALYDTCLARAREDAGTRPYAEALAEAFREFPDEPAALIEADLAWYRYAPVGADLAGIDLATPAGRAAAVRAGAVAIEPLTYEDFLPVSAAGIFRSNLGDAADESYLSVSSQTVFEEALGREVVLSRDLYEQEQSASLTALRS
jgi:uncharacterized glyoxalase superfamily metalloenzyme YdcJ